MRNQHGIILLCFVLIMGISSCSPTVPESTITPQPTATRTIQPTLTTTPIPYDDDGYFNSYEIYDHLEINAREIWRPLPHNIEEDNHVRNVEILDINPEPDQISADEYGNQIAYWKNISGSIEINYILDIRTSVLEVEPDDIGIYDQASEVYQEYTQATDEFPSDDESVISLAKEVVENETNPYLQAVLINNYVHGYDCCLEEDHTDRADILGYIENQQVNGCGGYAWVIVTLLRSLEIPTRTASGLHYPEGLVPSSERRDPDPDHFNNHSWAEVYLPNYGWVDLDQTNYGVDYRIPLSISADIVLDETRFTSVPYFHSPRTIPGLQNGAPSNDWGKNWIVSIMQYDPAKWHPDAYTDYGNPPQTTRTDRYNPAGFLDYDRETHQVYSRWIHGRPVTIAIEKAAGINQYDMEQIANNYFQTYAEAWEIFGGNPFPSYTVVLENEPEFAGGEHGIGYESTVKEYLQELQFPGGGERISHEVTHIWIGNALQDQQESAYDDGLWFREGFTQYYGDYLSGEDEFQSWMEGHYYEYMNRILNTDYDIPLTEMPAKAKNSGNDTYRLNVYWKGALVAYMMDTQLSEEGLCLNDVLKALYEKYALTNRSFTTTDVLHVFNDISESDWTPFFDTYIYGTEPLPLDGTFTYLKHE